ncbi:MAG: DotU family type IV/VI secretion system protein [Succinivibrio sp.]|nr:DotU family type IV/VI secretion system protein [Succinivibrio sp.]
MSTTNIEELVMPLLRKICEYHTFKEAGFEVPEEVMESELKLELSAIKTRCESLPLLQQQFKAIYKPLIFFIDYTVKEGGFSYSGSYKELARNFNEYSGDDKFFDLLEDQLHRDDDKELLRLFYIMMGLGFDGIYKRRRSDTLPVMKRCLEKMNPLPDLVKEGITPEIRVSAPQSKQKTTHWYQQPQNILLILLVLLLITFQINYFALNSSVSAHDEALAKTAVAASPYEQANARSELMKNNNNTKAQETAQ